MAKQNASLRTTLRATGRRLTGQRQLLLDFLREHGGHLAAQELFTLAHARDARLNLSTVYRTLALLRDLGLVDERHLGEDHHHYELRTQTTHYHLRCQGCGEVIEFASPLVEQLQAEIAGRYRYRSTEAQIDLFGFCAACQARMAG
jgi:Fe2+ or Zn2+ uptake regulation protein